MAQSSTSGTAPRRHLRENDSVSISSRVADIAEWEANEALRQRELEEARGRAAQMEKTMRWWSDCTANWREKWSKVRNERNKAREECKQLRTKLDSVLKETSSSKKKKEELEIQNEHLKKEIEKIHLILLKHAGQFDSQLFEALSEDPLKDFVFNSSSPVKLENGVYCTENQDSDTLSTISKEISIDDYILKGAVPKYVSDLKGDTSDKNAEVAQSEVESKDSCDEEYVMQKLSMLQLRLDETTKTLQIERDEKTQLHHTIDDLKSELLEMKTKCDELRELRQDSARELLSLQDQHQEEVRLLKADLQDEANSREGLERRINDLRAELERLQAENAAEWGKKERLETEKLALERDNKKLRTELRDMQERMERRGRPWQTSDEDVRHLQQELLDKNKEIAELRHSQSKMKKMVQDKIGELAHASRRAEQYEAEVKKLRTRVEELKKDLAVAEDELDTASNNVKRLQRTNDELQEQVDNFQIQLQHLHSRLRNSAPTTLLSHRGVLSNEEGSDDDLPSIHY
ncbi:coiled-coil domain-containing protein 102A isoform X1 [Coccinella septempunctata]|uniref:coiled-coil domain-containing protein 102A isoform X1 n=1 Tax=Coccinella septempunctata TaxID=41139 RepID=UPI001D07636A|nr:coiled-coil domain-containing protein 102A isoform X1 [Coccinella septempunctata]